MQTRLVVIGASMGGVKTLRLLLASLPDDLQALAMVPAAEQLTIEEIGAWLKKIPPGMQDGGNKP